MDAMTLSTLSDTTKPLLQDWARALRDDAEAHYHDTSAQLPVLARQDLLKATHHLLWLIDHYCPGAMPDPMGSH